jgi:lipoprotein-anchoring transpeptidase ErfK/SrfK
VTPNCLLRLVGAVAILVAATDSAFSQSNRSQSARPTPKSTAPAAASRPFPARSATPAQSNVRAAPSPTPAQAAPMRKASELISRQAPININKSAYDSLTSDNARVVVSLSKQRAFLFNGEQVAIDSPISSGKRAGMTPSGSFSVLEKDKDHRSSVYGDFKDSGGRTVRGGVSVRIDSAPSGTHFVGAPMLWFMRLTDDGVGMHVGILPGYPASHGCIRMPPQAAEMFYNKVKIGTPVRVES